MLLQDIGGYIAAVRGGTEYDITAYGDPIPAAIAALPAHAGRPRCQGDVPVELQQEALLVRTNVRFH
jgi:antitoxin (DNA-binding transcriptional repressor) of toxin-antitoxin stability system